MLPLYHFTEGTLSLPVVSILFHIAVIAAPLTARGHSHTSGFVIAESSLRGFISAFYFILYGDC
jgi:hypothetical protein